MGRLEIFIILVLFLVLFLVGVCSIQQKHKRDSNNSSEMSYVKSTSDSYAEKFVKSIKYIRDDRTGLCFGIFTPLTSNTVATGIGIVCVPCESVKDILDKAKGD